MATFETVKQPSKPASSNAGHFGFMNEGIFILYSFLAQCETAR
jgi:hypothetical protein